MQQQSETTIPAATTACLKLPPTQSSMNAEHTLHRTSASDATNANIAERFTDGESTSKSTSSLKKTNINGKNSGRKRARRVSFAKNIETVYIVENLRLDLTEDERATVWITAQTESAFIQQALVANLFGEDTTTSSPVTKQSPRTNNSIFFGGDNNNNCQHGRNINTTSNKKRRRKGHGRRRSGVHSAEHSPKPQLCPNEPLVKCSRMRMPSPLKSITSRLGLRNMKKKALLQLPFRN